MPGPFLFSTQRVLWLLVQVSSWISELNLSMQLIPWLRSTSVNAAKFPADNGVSCLNVPPIQYHLSSALKSPVVHFPLGGLELNAIGYKKVVKLSS